MRISSLFRLSTLSLRRCVGGALIGSPVCHFIRNISDMFNVVFVLGGPGAGKGTQCAKIVKEFGYVHLSAGDLLRAEREKCGSLMGDMINEHIRNGTIVPVEVTCSLLEQAMVASGRSNFLVDGFPRNKDNLDGWSRTMDDKARVQCVLFFDCPLQVCLKRCLSRGASGSGRTDDNEISLTKRFDTYMNSTMPIIRHYQQLQLVHQFAASGSVDEIFTEVRAVFEKLNL